MNWEISVFQLKLPTLITNAMKIINFDDVLCLLFKLAISKAPPSFWLILYGISGTKICFKKKTFHHVHRPSLGQKDANTVHLHKKTQIFHSSARFTLFCLEEQIYRVYTRSPWRFCMHIWVFLIQFRCFCPLFNVLAFFLHNPTH